MTSIVASNSSVSQCINIPGLYPSRYFDNATSGFGLTSLFASVLSSTNGSIIPQVDTYLRSICSTPACSDALIDNTTEQVLTSCATDLSNFGIPQNVVRIAMDAYPTARKVVCLSTNSSMLSNSTTVGYNATTNSTLCPTALLDDVQAYVGVPLSTRYLSSLLLGGNATAYNTILQIANNQTVAQKFACNDCVHAAVDVVLEDYPQLENKTFSLGNSPLATNVTGSNYTVGQFYEGLCGVPVGSNVSLPMSINETAYNTTIGANATSAALPSSTASSSVTGMASILPIASSASSAVATATGVAGRSVQIAKKRFVRWD